MFAYNDGFGVGQTNLHMEKLNSRMELEKIPQILKLVTRFKVHPSIRLVNCCCFVRLFVCLFPVLEQKPYIQSTHDLKIPRNHQEDPLNGPRKNLSIYIIALVTYLGV